MTSKIKFYEYSKCSTCQKAARFLSSQNIDFERIPIVDSPPTAAELKTMLRYLTKAGGSIRSLFNTSGSQYREMKVGLMFEKGMTEDEALKLLAVNGKLIKRPFVIANETGTVGFNAANKSVWAEITNSVKTASRKES